MDLMLKAKLEDFYREELADKQKYCEFAKSIEHECPMGAGILRDIAKEEHTHADLIKHIIDKIN